MRIRKKELFAAICLIKLWIFFLPQSNLFYLLIVGVQDYCCTWSHSDTPHSVGLHWTRDRPVSETSPWQSKTFTKDRHPCSWQDSNSQSPQVSGRRPTPYTSAAAGMNFLRRINSPIMFRCTDYLTGVLELSNGQSDLLVNLTLTAPFYW